MINTSIPVSPVIWLSQIIPEIGKKIDLTGLRPLKKTTSHKFLKYAALINVNLFVSLVKVRRGLTLLLYSTAPRTFLLSSLRHVQQLSVGHCHNKKSNHHPASITRKRPPSSKQR